jgi:hypothetical protein
VFAILTNLLGAEPEQQRRFFDALRPYYGRAGTGAEMMRRVESAFQDGRPLADAALDLATFGTPVRYGWDSGGYSKLLHFVYHRCHPACEPHLAIFPFQLDDVLTGAGGDYIQQIGIAGTNFTPSPLALWRTWRTELRLNTLLQPNLRRRDLASRLAVGMRIPSEGQALLVDYSQCSVRLARSIAGHAVYTLRELMLFHAEEIANRFYRDEVKMRSQ